MTTDDIDAEEQYPDCLTEFGMCIGFEGWYGCCALDCLCGDYLCKRCREIARGYAAEERERLEQERRRKRGLFTDEEKEIMKEGRTEDECKAFDRECSIAEFLEGLRNMFRSHTDYVLAQLGDGARIPSRAANVIVWRDGRFSTVREMVDHCASHDWNRAIYEFWVMETAARVRGIISKLSGVSACALTDYAKHVDFYDPDPYEGGEFEVFQQNEE